MDTKKFKLNNHQTVKVSEALKKGNRWINIPSFLLLLFFFFVCPAILLYVFRHDGNNVILIIGSISSMLLGIILPLLWWSTSVVKFKIWAADNVKDIHRFYAEAQSKKLINEGKFFRAIEIKSEKQKSGLLKFYERLSSEKLLIRDINNEIGSEVLFKKPYVLSVAIFAILFLGICYLYTIGNIKENLALGLGSVLLLLIGFEFYKAFRNTYILKINRDIISYKDEKTMIFWKDVISYNAIPGTHNIPSKLIVATEKETHEFILDGFHKIRLNKVIDVLNENKHRSEINQSMK